VIRTKKEIIIQSPKERLQIFKEPVRAYKKFYQTNINSISIPTTKDYYSKDRR